MRILPYVLLMATSALSAQDSLELESITIRGTKEKKTYKETTSSITTIKEEKLSDLAQSNSLNALNGISNVQVSQDKNGAESFSIRGINNSGVTGVQKDSLSSILIDDVFQSDLALRTGSLDFWDISSLEIHRGGQATTQGINSLAGTIIVNHHEPTFFPEGKLKLGIGSFNRQEIGVMTNNEIIPGKLTSRISYNRDMTDGYITNVTTNNDKWGQRNRDAANVSLLYLLNDSDKLSFDVKFFQLKNGGAYVQGPKADAFKHQVFEDVDYNRKAHNIQGSVRYDKKINENMSNALIFAYSDTTSKATSDADGTKNPIAGTRREKMDDQMFTLENLFNYKNGKVSNTVGFNIHKYELNDRYDFNVMSPTGGTGPGFQLVDATQSQKNNKTIISAFDSYTYDFNKEHSLNVGLRLEYAINKYETFVRGDYSGSDPWTIAFLNGVNGSFGDETNKLMALPKVGYVYHLNERNDLGFSYSQAYRNGGVSVNRRRARVHKYDPELTNNYELSHKFDAKFFRISTNVFYTDWRKQQVLVTQRRGDPYDGQIENASKSELYGAEVQGDIRVTEDHTFSMSTGVVKTKFKEFFRDGRNYSGNEFPKAPKYTAMTAVRSQWTEFLSTNLVGRFIGRSYSDVDNKDGAPNQFYLDFTTHYVFSSYGVELYGKNLLDKNYQLYDGTPKYANIFPGTYHQTSTPREFGVRLTYQW